MFTYTVRCPECRYETSYMWQTSIKKINRDNNEQTMNFRCPICDKLFEFKRIVKFSQPFSIKEVEEVKEE